MAVESDAERLELLTVDDWGVVVTVAGADYVGIFDDDYVPVLGASSTGPRVLMRTSDVSAASITDGTAMTINGTSYTARVVRQDGTGMTEIQVEDV